MVTVNLSLDGLKVLMAFKKYLMQDYFCALCHVLKIDMQNINTKDRVVYQKPLLL